MVLLLQQNIPGGRQWDPAPSCAGSALTAAGKCRNSEVQLSGPWQKPFCLQIFWDRYVSKRLESVRCGRSAGCNSMAVHTPGAMLHIRPRTSFAAALAVSAAVPVVEAVSQTLITAPPTAPGEAEPGVTAAHAAAATSPALALMVRTAGADVPCGRPPPPLPPPAAPLPAPSPPLDPCGPSGPTSPSARELDSSSSATASSRTASISSRSLLFSTSSSEATPPPIAAAVAAADAPPPDTPTAPSHQLLLLLLATAPPFDTASESSARVCSSSDASFWVAALAFERSPLSRATCRGGVELEGEGRSVRHKRASRASSLRKPGSAHDRSEAGEILGSIASQDSVRTEAFWWEALGCALYEARSDIHHG